MPIIRVVYKIEKYDFDYVTSELLDTLIEQDEISHFYRPSEGRWINIRLDPLRGSGGGYQGPERRGTVNKTKSIGEKGRLNAGAYCSGWLEGLWRVVEGHDGLG
jgi:hypothetical protein